MRSGGRVRLRCDTVGCVGADLEVGAGRGREEGAVGGEGGGEMAVEETVAHGVRVGERDEIGLGVQHGRFSAKHLHEV